MKYELKWVYIKCEACDGDGVDDSQDAHVGCVMCGGTGKQNVVWNPLWDVTLTSKTKIDDLAKELKIPYSIPNKHYLELMFRVALEVCDSEYINTMYFKNVFLRYMEHEATEEGCERIHVILYKWADANLPPCTIQWNLYDKVYRIETMKPKQIKSLDLIRVIDDAMWEGELKQKQEELEEMKHSDLYDYLDGCNDIGYCT